MSIVLKHKQFKNSKNNKMELNISKFSQLDVNDNKKG